MSLINGLTQVNHHITLEEAVALTTRYRSNMNMYLKPEYAETDLLPLSETFNKEIFNELASQNGCVAIRSYFGLDENQQIRLIFVGVDQHNEDILSLMFEHGNRCPPICGSAGPLKP